MRHLDITQPDKKSGFAKIMVTITGNNFGDQVLELKEFKGSHYEVIKTDSNEEGSHLDPRAIKVWAYDWAIRTGAI